MPTGQRARAAFALVAVGLIALIARWAYLHVLKDQELFFGLFLDSQHYARQAAMIRDGEGIGPHPYLFSPFYPYFLSLFTNSAGKLNVGLVQAVQALFGAGTAALTTAIGLRLGGSAVGWIAGLVVALHGPLIHLDSMILVSSLQTFFFTLALWLVLVAADSRPRWLTAGLALGATAILRPTGLLIVAALAAVLVLRGRWKPVLFLLLGVVLVVSPFTLRNLIRTGEPVLLSVNGGVNFWIGNHAGATGLYYGLPAGTDIINDPLSKHLAERRAGRELTYQGASRWWFGQAVEDIREDPMRWGRLMVRKGLFFLGPTEISQLGSSFHWYREQAWPLRSSVDARWIFVLALMVPFVRKRFSGEELGWVVSFFMPYVLGICLFFVTARHRSPIMPAAIVLAACAVVGIWEVFRSGEWRGRPLLHLAPVAGVILLGLASHALYAGPGAPFYISERTGQEERHRGVALFDSGRYEEAVEAYRRSLELSEDFITRTNLANALKSAGRIEEAVVEYEKSLSLNPRWGLGWYNYGVLLANDLKQFSRAEQAFQTAIRYAPLLPEAHYRLGLVYLQSGRPREAERALRRSLELAPQRGSLRPDAERALALATARP